MKFTIVAVGKLKEKFWTAACAEYLKRMQPYGKTEVREIADIDPARAGGVDAARDREGAAILAALPGVHYEGVTGVIEFDDIGDAKRDAAYIKEANTETGAWEFVAVQTVEQ